MNFDFDKTFDNLCRGLNTSKTGVYLYGTPIIQGKTIFTDKTRPIWFGVLEHQVIYGMVDQYGLEFR